MLLVLVLVTSPSSVPDRNGDLKSLAFAVLSPLLALPPSIADRRGVNCLRGRLEKRGSRCPLDGLGRLGSGRDMVNVMPRRARRDLGLDSEACGMEGRKSAGGVEGDDKGEE